jgi:outer membrane protein TolC
MSASKTFLLVLTAVLISSAIASTGEVADVNAPLDASRDFPVSDTQLALLIADLLKNNPEVRAAAELADARREQIPQARALPDPQLTYRWYASTPETRVGPQRQGLEVSQPLPGHGKRRLQAQRAGHQAAGATWAVRDLQRGLVAELKRAYFDAAYLQEALAINAEETSLLRRFEQIALTRYSTGEGIQQSVIKVQTDITRLADRRTALRTRLLVAERKIAGLLGPGEPLVLEPIRLRLPESRVDATALQEEAIARNPRIRAAQERIEADRVAVRRQLRESRPDLSVGLGYVDVGRREDAAGRLNPPDDNGQDIWALNVRLNIPLYRDRRRAGVAEAEGAVRSSEYALRGIEDRLRYEVQESVLRLESSTERARLYRDLLIPQAEQSLGSAETAYSTNRQPFLDLLDAERVLFEVRRTYHRLLADLWISLADLERVIARPLAVAVATENTP